MGLYMLLILIHYDIAMNIDLTQTHTYTHLKTSGTKVIELYDTWAVSRYAHESLTYRVLSMVKVRLNYLQQALIRS